MMTRSLVVALLLSATSCQSPPDITTGATAVSTSARAIDGDTFAIADRRYRLAGIDAPELPGHCQGWRQRANACAPGNPWLAKAALQQLISDGIICRATGVDYYHRTLVDCNTGDNDSGADVGEWMMSHGYAIQYVYRGGHQ